MKEYLKMADYISGTNIQPVVIREEDGSSVRIISLHGKEAEFAAHAINSHDELVAEVKKLRSELADAWFMVDEIKLSLDRRSRQAEYWESIAKE